MGYGHTLTEHVDQQIESAACVIALWSPASVTHDGLLAVAESARRRNVLLPVVIAPVTIPFPFDQLRTFPLVSWYRSADDSGFLQLTERIKRFVADWRNRDAATPSLGAVAQPSTPRARGSGLFLCYRREDTQDAAGRLHDRLVEAYRTERVFMDIDSVPLGIDFVEHVTEQIGKCSAVIVMIGKQWRTIKDKKRRRRLDNEDDLVRAEIRAALQQKIPVIPVTVQNAAMPQAEDLPDDIRLLARRNGIELSATRWRTDVDRLIKELDRVMKPPSGSGGVSLLPSA
jgi:hypothetical protein